MYRMLDSRFELLYLDYHKSSALPVKLNQQENKQLPKNNLLSVKQNFCRVGLYIFKKIKILPV